MLRFFRNQQFSLFLITVRPVFARWRSVARRLVVGYFLLEENGRITDLHVVSFHSLIRIPRFSFLSFMLEVWSNFFSRELEGCKMWSYYKRYVWGISHNLLSVGGLKICFRLIRGKECVRIYIHRRSICQIAAKLRSEPSMLHTEKSFRNNTKINNITVCLQQLSTNKNWLFSRKINYPLAQFVYLHLIIWQFVSRLKGIGE